MNRLIALTTASLALVISTLSQTAVKPEPQPDSSTPQVSGQAQTPSTTLPPATAPATSAPPETKNSGAPGKEKEEDAASKPNSADKSDAKTDNSLPEPKKEKTDESTPAATKPNTSDEKEKPQEESKSPHTEMFGTAGSGSASADPLLEPPPLPPAKPTLIGGVARKVDRIRNRLVLEPFGAKNSMRVFFDERSHIYRDGRETTVMGIHPGDRVYVDTMLVGPRVFAKNVRVQTTSKPAEAMGQIVGYDERQNQLKIIDRLTGQSVSFSIGRATQLSSKTGQARLADLVPGTLVDVTFAPAAKGGDAKQVVILAVPGQRFMFAGRVTYVDLRNGIVAIENQSDGKNYEVSFDPQRIENREQLIVGSEVTTDSTFDGRRYSTRTFIVTAPSSKAQPEQR